MTPNEMNDLQWQRLLIQACTAPADRERAEDAIRKTYAAFYESAPPPQSWFWCSSLYAMEYVHGVLAGRIPSAFIDLRSREPLKPLDGDPPESFWSRLKETLPLFVRLGRFRLRFPVEHRFSSTGTPFSYLEMALAVQGIGEDWLRGAPFVRLSPELARARIDTYALPPEQLERIVETVLVDRSDASSCLKQKYLLGLRWEAASACLWWCPFENAVLLCDRPAKVCIEDGRAHCDGGPAVEWRDGVQSYALNGVNVPRWLAELPAEQIDARRMLSETNAEVRREIVRKIGIERICRDLNALCLDRRKGYELLMLNLGDGRRRPYLKMDNLSTGTSHIEGVHPECRTVTEALAWRNGVIETPVELT